MSWREREEQMMRVMELRRAHDAEAAEEKLESAIAFVFVVVVAAAIVLAGLGCDAHRHVVGPTITVTDTVAVHDTVWTRPPHGKPPRPR